MKLIVGLGNPGARYERTRHNVGFWVIDRLTQRYPICLGETLGTATVGRGCCGSESIVLAKPQTFMNRSGQSVAALLQGLELTLADLLVVYDDLDLPFGRLRVRARGSAGGHRGVQSLIENVGGAEFSRVRIGIGRPPTGVEVVDYVLESLDQESLQRFEGVVDRAADAVDVLIKSGVGPAMQQFNSDD